MPLGITYSLTTKQFNVLLRTGNHIKRLSVKFTNCIENKFNFPTRIAGRQEIKQFSFGHDESVKKGHRIKQFKVLLRTDRFNLGNYQFSHRLTDFWLYQVR